MVRKPQELSPYTPDEMLAIAEQLEQAADVLRKAAACTIEKGEQSLYVMYPKRIREANAAAATVYRSFNKSYLALLAGKPLGADSFSARSIRRRQEGQ